MNETVCLRNEIANFEDGRVYKVLLKENATNENY